MKERLNRSFFRRDVLDVAPDLLGKYLVLTHKMKGREVYTITETEAYRGVDDLACHASKGRTARNELMFGDGGYLYMYLIYGIHWMMNVVTSVKEVPQAVLLRGLLEVSGPGRLTSLMGVDGNYNGEDLVNSPRIGIYMNGKGRRADYTTGPRVGIDYAGEPWKSQPWRFVMNL